MNHVLTPQMVAVRLHVGKETVLHWLRTGKLKGKKLGYRTWRIAEDDLEEFIRGKADDQRG